VGKFPLVNALFYFPFGCLCGWRGAGLAALLALPLAAGQLAAQPAPAEDGWLRLTVPVRRELVEVLPIDLDGDGRMELVVVESDRDSRAASTHLEVLHQTATGFEPLQEASDTLPKEVTLVGAGRFAGGPGLALLTPEGLEVRLWAGGRFRTRTGLSLRLESLFPKAGTEPSAGLEWIVDLDGDGVSDLLVPRLDGFQWIAQDAAGALVSRGILHTRPRAELLWWYQRRRVAYDLPMVAYVPGKRPGGKDVLAYDNGLVSLFHLDGKAGAQDRLPDVEADLQPPQPFDPKAPWDPPLLLILAADLNRDGVVDLVFSKAKSGDSDLNAKTSILVYYGRRTPQGETAFRIEPDQVFALEGFTLPIVRDLDGRGRIDLVLVNVEINFWTAVKAVVARSVSADAMVYRMGADGRYPAQPNEQETFSVKFSLGRFSHRPMSLFGDFNGDGQLDLLLSQGKDELGLYWGRKGRFWNGKPDATVKGNFPIAAVRARVLDVDGDGRDDLLLTYVRDDIRQMPEVNRTAAVLLSRHGRAGAATAERAR
jgi:hypothetical protein